MATRRHELGTWNLDGDWVAFVIATMALIVLFVGTPDLHDALLYNLADVPLPTASDK